MRLPKRGFCNPFKVKNIIINLDTIVKNTKIDKSKAIDRAALIKAGIIRPTQKNPIKLLAGKSSADKSSIEASLPENLSFRLDACSVQAKEKIAQAKGMVEYTPKKEKKSFKKIKKQTK